MLGQRMELNALYLKHRDVEFRALHGPDGPVAWPDGPVAWPGSIILKNHLAGPGRAGQHTAH